MLKDDFVVHSELGDRCSTEVSLLIGRSFYTDVDLVFAGDAGRLVVADVAVKSFAFRVVMVYESNYIGERRSFFRQLELFLNDSKLIVLVDDWNVILDPKIDKAGRGASGLDRCESSLVDFMPRFQLLSSVISGREMWSWIDSSPYVRIWSYLDRVLDELTLISFLVLRSTGLGRLTHKLVRVILHLEKRA